jgi:inhibitor of cysteine peptidase
MKKYVFILVIVLLLASACQSSSLDPITLTSEDAGKTIELKKGDTIQITLKGNPTTGYNWFLAAQRQAIVQQIGTPSYKADSQLLGSPGMITLTFKAVSSGQTALHLDYKRSWETGAAPANTYEVNLVVK